MWHLVVIYCWKYFVNIFPEANALLCSRTESELFLSHFVSHREAVSCPELRHQWNTRKHNFRVQLKLPEPFLHPELSFCPCIKFFFTSFTPQSGNLFFWDFAGARVRSDNRHNQRKHNEVHAFIRALVFKGQFHPCSNDNFFVRKDMLLKSLFRSCFQIENLNFLVISLI